MELPGGSPRYHKIDCAAEKIGALLCDLFIESQAKEPDQIVHDLDATGIPLYGHQPERFFHGYYDSDCYLPLTIFGGDQLQCARLRASNVDGAAGALDEVKRIEAQLLHAETGRSSRVFTVFNGQTHKSWARARRVVAKAEYLDKGDTPRFAVTSITPDRWAARELYEQFYCQRGEMENRIKEQMCLFAYRLSTEAMKGNRLRLYLSAPAYTLVEALRRLALKGTGWAEAQVDTIRLKLFKIDALVRISARRVWLQLSSTYPWKPICARAFDELRCRTPLPPPDNPFSHLPVIGAAELCGKSNFDPPSPLQLHRRSTTKTTSGPISAPITCPAS